MDNKISFDEFMRQFEIQFEESAEEFIYKTLSPFCENVVEKHLSKKELEKILRRGMQPSISLDRLKEFRNEVANIDNIAIIQRLDELIAEGENE